MVTKVNPKFPITHVVFSRIHPRGEVDVPVAEAAQFFEDAQRKSESYTISMVRLSDGSETYAKSFHVWDAEAGVHHLASVGLGANGWTVGLVTEYNPHFTGPTWDEV